MSEIEFLNEEEEDQTTENPADIETVTGAVTFDHVQFGYNPDQIIIHDFCAKVKPGQKIAIVGPTGAGKTTMVKLLMRYYDVNSGAILLDDHNIRDFNRRELRDAFGMVLQDTWLFKGSIMENIRYGRLDATDEEVIAAAKAARAHHFIQTLPGGYQMELNEDASNVSQGQKQLLTIARAILADNKILILDEATSSVDTRTEIEIQKAMDNLMKGRTSFVIAHRLSTIKDADVILVMKDGDIIEQGNHEELLAQNAQHKDWACTEELMKTTKDGKALYLHCLPADITGVSCETGEVDASVFDRYRIPLYKEASYKPYVIAAMIMLSKFENPQDILKKLEVKAAPRILK